MVIWLWRAQRSLGTAVGEAAIADRLRVPVETLYKKLSIIPTIQPAIVVYCDTVKRVHNRVGWCYYVVRDPTKSVAKRAQGAVVPGRVSKVQPARSK